MSSKVFVSRRIPARGLDKVLAAADAEVWEDELPPPYEILVEKAQSADGLLCLLTDRIDAPLMDAAPGLKVISNFAVGYDNIDVPAATERGIPIGNTPGVLTETTADFAWALLMAAARRVAEGDRYTRKGQWKTWGPTLLLGQDVHDATLGIIGFGRIGQAVARRAQGFGMRILYYDIQRNEEAESTLGAEYVDLDTLLQKSDFVSVHTWLSDETYHLISDREFGIMKETAILINDARGPIVDPDALHRALSKGKIAYAALDVTDPEPLPVDHPLVTLDNILITPHIASASTETRGLMASMAADNLLAGLAGEQLPNCVNPEVYDRE
ncbi:MAG: 2-hydroxyacid dehydrogenase [Anaerolineae bacterium]